MAVKQMDKATALIIGGGIAGIKAAIELAACGINVFVCDYQQYIGGTLTKLENWFPDNHCGMCQILPTLNRDDFSQYCLRRGLVHPNIKLLPLTIVKKIEGKAGDFLVTLCTESAWVNRDLCIGCGLCEQACPVEVSNDLNIAQGKHKAIHLLNPMILPKHYSIDKQYCTECGACVDICPTDAISLSSPDSTHKIKTETIIYSTGLENFDPLPATQYGYGRYPNVVTNIELEGLLNPAGPSQGKLIRRSDARIPKSIAFIQCVGSRDIQSNYCSSICCMSAIKEAMMIKKSHPEINVRIFFMDLRAFGKGYYRYYEQARDKMGIQFTRCRIPTIKQDFRSKDLLIVTDNQQSEVEVARFDMVVLSLGQKPSLLSKETNHILGLESNKWNFCETKTLSPIETNKQGIYVCGSISSPKDIADNIAEGIAAAGHALTQVASGKNNHIYQSVSSEVESKVAVFICRCGQEIGKVVNIKELAEFSESLPDVTLVQDMPYLCHEKNQKDMEKAVKKVGANRVVIAACSDIIPSKLFNQISTEIINIREQLAWVHEHRNKEATEKAKILIAMAVEKMGKQRDYLVNSDTVTPKALIIGGGLAGLSAALAIANRGFQAVIIEKSDEVGGNMKQIHYLLKDEEPQAYLNDLIDKVKANPRIHLYLGSEIIDIKGYAGNFTLTLENKDSDNDIINVGAIIVATGAEQSCPSEYLYGQVKQVITQRELEAKISNGDLDIMNLKSLVMIQCVGSRDEQRPYCSRVCCMNALKNALALKQQNPDVEILILYRDLMSYGFQEEYYSLAREQGVIFAQYSLDSKPVVSFDNGALNVQAVETVVGRSIVVNPDLLVLSPAIIPYDNSKLAQMLGVELTDDGFFKEAEPKFRPVDFTKDGVFVCGLAHSPQNVTETIVQAQAAAQRAASLLDQLKLIPGRVFCQVNERRCSGCELCIAMCPYDARVKDIEKGVVLVQQASCQGCGACVAACPNGAANLGEFQDKQILSMLNVAI